MEYLRHLKTPKDVKIRKIRDLIKLKDFKVNFKGTSSINDLLPVASDYDFSQNIDLNKIGTPEEVFNKINQILENVYNTPNLYFIQLKIKNKKGDEEIFTPKNKFNKNKFMKIYGNGDIEYISLETIYYNKNKFEGIGIGYNFDYKHTDKKQNKSINLVEDFYNKINKKLYMKALRRLFVYYTLHKNKKELEYLGKFFKSSIGKLYKLTSDLEIIEKVLENYKDKETYYNAITALKRLNINPNITSLKKEIKKNMNIINKYSKMFIDEYYNF